MAKYVTQAIEGLKKHGGLGHLLSQNQMGEEGGVGDDKHSQAPGRNCKSCGDNNNVYFHEQ